MGEGSLTEVRERTAIVLRTAQSAVTTTVDFPRFAGPLSHRLRRSERYRNPAARPLRSEARSSFAEFE